MMKHFTFSAMTPLLLGTSLIWRPIAAQPTHLDGEYHFKCHDSSLTLHLLGMNDVTNTMRGSTVLPVYCGDDDDSNNSKYNEYQERLGVAKDEFEANCNKFLGNSDSSTTFCSNATTVWGQALEDMNEYFAGWAPQTLAEVVVEEKHSSWWDWLVGWWDIESKLILADNRELPIKYKIDRRGGLVGVLVDDAPHTLNLDKDGNAAGCYGAFGIQSQGHLKEDGTSTLFNKYLGGMVCGMLVEGVPLGFAFAVGVDAHGAEIDAT